MIRVFCDSCKSELSSKQKYYKGVALSAAPSNSGMTYVGWASDKITCEVCYLILQNLYRLWEAGWLNTCQFCGDKGSYWEQGPNTYTTCTQCNPGRVVRRALCEAIDALNRRQGG